jgi:coproporphyrinogen III oxidase
MVIANDTGTRISFYKTDSTEDWTDLNHFIQKTNNTFLERYDLIANRRIFHLGYTNESGNTNDEIEFTSLLRRGV